MALSPRTDMRSRKSDGDDIAAFMAALPARLQLGKQRRWWPRCLFRSDHVENAAQILNAGRVISRALAERTDVITHDSASAQHIGQLTSQQRDLVRLYFRPRAPTQFANEGIRPVHAIEYGAHMPVPIYFLFSAQLLEYSDVGFTRGRLASGTEIGKSQEFLSSIPFADVYHDGRVALTGSRRGEILNARHAEVVIPRALKLDHLRYIVCRSSAERDSLLYLLTDEARSRWGRQTVVDQGKLRLFHKRGTFLQRVELERDRLSLHWYANIEPRCRGPFDVRAHIVAGTDELQGNVEGYSVSGVPLEFDLERCLEAYTVRITMNRDLAYVGRFDGGQAKDTLLSSESALSS